MPAPSLLDHFSALKDPRQAGKVLCPLPEIMLVVLCATLAGADDFVEIRQWGDMKIDFLRRMLPFARGIPSHDTLNDVMNALPGELFGQAFTGWVEGLRKDAPDPTAPEVAAIDGKTSRRARRGEGPALHMVSGLRRRANGSCWGKRRRGRSRTRSMRYRCCLSACT